jgi:hypothetical protein
MQILEGFQRAIADYAICDRAAGEQQSKRIFLEEKRIAGLGRE